MSEASSEASSETSSPEYVGQAKETEGHAEFSSKRRKIEPTADQQKSSVPSRIKKKAKSSEDQQVQSGTSRTLLATTLEDTSFQALGIDAWLVAALSSMQIKRPTPIQAKSVPAILAGSDCIGGSKTGSGKTVAFSVPILQKWAKDQFGIFALILTPTR